MGAEQTISAPEPGLSHVQRHVPPALYGAMTAGRLGLDFVAHRFEVGAEGTATPEAAPHLTKALSEQFTGADWTPLHS